MIVEALTAIADEDGLGAADNGEVLLELDVVEVDVGLPVFIDFGVRDHVLVPLY